MSSSLISIYQKLTSFSNPEKEVALAWKNSTAMERQGFVSFVVDSWEKKPEKMAKQLPLLPMIDWQYTRQDLPLWMEMFVADRPAFNLTTANGQTAWMAWWNARSGQVHEAFEGFASLDSFQDISDTHKRAPSIQKSSLLIQKLPLLSEQVFGVPQLYFQRRGAGATQEASAEVRSSWIACLMAASDAQLALGCSPQWNYTSGAICEVLAPVFCTPDGVSETARQWWDEQGSILHPSVLRFGKWKGHIGLVGRPEYVFGSMIKEMIHAGLSGKELSQSNWDHLETMFWASSHQRYMQTPKDDSSLFLPSLNTIMDMARRYVHDIMSADHAQAWVARLDRMALSAASGCWPWGASVEQDQNRPVRRLRRM